MCLLLTLGLQLSMAQFRNNRKEPEAVTYEEVYDDPSDINKLFIALQPLYTDFFVTNVNVGFGGEATYFLKRKFEFRLHGRTVYAQPFDFARDVGNKNGTMDNILSSYTYFEGGATYHYKDEDTDGETRITYWRKNISPSKWAATVPDGSIVPCTIRKIIGIRAGGMSYNTTVDLNVALARQGVEFLSADSTALPGGASVFTNINTAGFYLGGAMTRIRNIAIKPSRTYPVLVDDLIFTTYADIIIAPFITVDDVVVAGQTYSAEQINTSWLGFRAGIDGKFNRKFGWSYNGEIGYRPGVATRGFYVLMKVGFPVFSTNLNYNREAFGK